MNILHLICSPRGHASRSAGYSRHIVEKLASGNTGSQVSLRCLNASTMPHIDKEFSLASRVGSADGLQGGSLELSDELISEVLESDVIVLATPVHNLSVPSSLKAWIDHIVRPSITFEYCDGAMVGLLTDRPVFVVLSSTENSWSDDGPDFIRPYLRAIFASIGIKSVEFFGTYKLLAMEEIGKPTALHPAIPFAPSDADDNT